MRVLILLLCILCPAASAGPVVSPWAVAGPDDTSGVAAAALSGWYAAGDSYEDSVELRDIPQNIKRTITRQEIAALLPWMDLNGSTDGVGALAFSDSGRLLFIAVHDAAAAGDGQGSDAVLRYDTQTGQLGVFARLELSGVDHPWPHGAMVFHAGRLYVGTPGAVRVYRAQMNDVSGLLLYAQATGSAEMVTGLAVDRTAGLLYAAWGGSVYRAAIAPGSLSFASVGAIPNVRGIAYGEHYGGAANPGLYVLDATSTPAQGRVWYISPSQARGLMTFAPTLYLSRPEELHDIAATADGKLLIGADEDALLVRDDSDTRLGFDAWARDEFSQVVTFARGLIAPDPGDLPGLVIDADVAVGATRFHPASPDAACWTVLLLLMNDHVNGDAAAQGQVRTILKRYAGLMPDGLSPDRTADGIYRHWIEPSTAGVSAWDPEFATMSTMKIVLAASRAASFYPQDAEIQEAARAIICGVENWESYLQPGTDRMYLKALAAGGPDPFSASAPFHEGMLFVSQAAAYGNAQAVYGRWLNRSLWPRPALVAGRAVSSNYWGGFLPAFVSLYELLLLPEFRASPDWQTHILNLRLSNAAWTDDNSPRFNTVFSAGTTKPEWGSYHADSLTAHPGDVTTFSSLLAFSAGTGAGGASTAEAVGAYNAYRRGARQSFATGATFLYRRSNVDPAYTPNSAGLPDVGLGALGLAELIQPGSLDAVLSRPYVPCTPACGTADFDGDGDLGTDADIEAFFACLAGNCCPSCYAGGADFNADGDVGTDADIESFFRVWAGGEC